MLRRSKLPNVGTTIFSVMSALANDVGAINLSQGFPDYAPPLDLIEAVDAAMRDGYNQYAPMPGSSALRVSIARKYAVAFNVDVDPELEVTVTPGATVALFTAIATVVQPGDEVIIFQPAYDSYQPAIETVGGVVRIAQLRAPLYRPDWDEVRSLVNDKTVMIIVNTPHNPTGSVWTREDLVELSTFANEHDLIVLSDEVYELITFNEPHTPLISIPGLEDRTFVVTSFGKTFHVTGWKVGACIASSALMLEYRKVHQFLSFSTNSAMQAGIATYMAEPEHYQGLSAFFQRKRDLFRAALDGSPWEIRPCAGSYFQLLGYDTFLKGADVDLAIELTRTLHVASIPLSPFSGGQQLDTALRFCFAKSDEVLLEAARRLKNVG